MKNFNYHSGYRTVHKITFYMLTEIAESVECGL